MISSRFNIKGKIAVVTGGNGLLGTEYVKTLLKAGVKVAILDTSETLNNELLELQNSGSEVVLYTCDIGNKKMLQETLQSIQKQWGTPTILINNAAIDTPLKGARGSQRFDELPEEMWGEAIRVNMTGVFLCCQIFGSAMISDKKDNGGSIVNVSSTYGLNAPHQELYSYKEKKGDPFYEKPITYTATKAGVIGMTKWLAVYWAKKGVRVNTLVPGGVFAGQDPEFLAGYEALTPMGRMAEKYEYNEAILFLASDASSYMTGSTLVVDGGWTAW